MKKHKEQVKCQGCGQFVPFFDLALGRALMRYNYETETPEFLCCSCYEKEGQD